MSGLSALHSDHRIGFCNFHTQHTHTPTSKRQQRQNEPGPRARSALSTKADPLSSHSATLCIIDSTSSGGVLCVLCVVSSHADSCCMVAMQKQAAIGGVTKDKREGNSPHWVSAWCIASLLCRYDVWKPLSRPR